MFAILYSLNNDCISYRVNNELHLVWLLPNLEKTHDPALQVRVLTGSKYGNPYLYPKKNPPKTLRVTHTRAIHYAQWGFRIIFIVHLMQALQSG